MAKFHNICSRQFDAYKCSEYAEIDTAVSNVLNILVTRRKSKGKRVRYNKALLKHIKVILLDLYVASDEMAYCGQRRASKWIAISRSKSAYGRVTRYDTLNLSYRHIIGVLRDLKDGGYIRQKIGFFDRRTRIGKQSRIRATAKLLDCFRIAGANTAMVGRFADETIVLRDKEKKLQEYVDTADTKTWRANLNAINSAIAKRSITLYLTDSKLRQLEIDMAHDPERGHLDFNRVYLKRVFNNGQFDEGGRFYGGWWQNIPKQYRQYIEIDFKGTREVDYSGLHIRMLYAKCHVQAPADPYYTAGIPREVQKTAMMILINANSAQSAINGLRKQAISNPREVLSAVARDHPKIANYFYSGIGIKLQFLDSCIAEQVLLATIKKGGIALPVHDSFIVRIGRERELQADMEAAFVQMFPGQQAAMKSKESDEERQARERRERGELESDGFVSDDVEELMREEIAKYSRYYAEEMKFRGTKR